MYKLYLQSLMINHIRESFLLVENFGRFCKKKHFLSKMNQVSKISVRSHNLSQSFEPRQFFERNKNQKTLYAQMIF